MATLGQNTPPRQIINNGSFLNDPLAETVFAAFQKTNINFDNLWQLIQNQGYEKIFLDLSGVDVTQSELEYVAEAIENGVDGGQPWEIARAGRKPLFYTVTPTGNGFEYRFYRVHKKGQIFGGSGGVLITADDISPAGSMGVSSSNSDSFINLGNIGASEVWTAFNQGDGGNPWTVRGLTLVTATQNGVFRTWIFIGNQRLGIDEGQWGGSNITDPNYLASTSSDFHLVTNQPVVFPDNYVSKNSKRYINTTLDVLPIDPERTTYSINGGSGELKGFSFGSTFSSVQAYDGMDVFIRNGSGDVIEIKANEPVQIPLNFGLFIQSGEIVHLKFNKGINRVEFVGMLPEGNRPVPFGQLRVLKIEGNTDDLNLEVGDRVVTSNLNNDIYLAFGEYIGGDPMELLSYNQTTIDYFDPLNP